MYELRGRLLRVEHGRFELRGVRRWLLFGSWRGILHQVQRRHILGPECHEVPLVLGGAHFDDGLGRVQRLRCRHVRRQSRVFELYELRRRHVPERHWPDVV